MAMHTLDDLFVEELQDLYDAENQILKALPKMAETASHSELRRGFEQHFRQTEEHVHRLERVFHMIGQKTEGRHCKGMEGLIKEGTERIRERADNDVKDAGLIGAAQRVEHYEIAGYGCARTYARMLGHHEAANLLQLTLDEEGETDKKLTAIAEGWVNAAAR